MKEVYIASGWFNPKQAEQLEKIKKMLDEMSITYFSPKDEALATSNDSQTRLKEVFKGNIDGIKNSNYLIANTQDKDMGTIFECGCAYNLGIPIIYFAEGLTGPFNLILAQSGFGVATSIDELKELIKKFNFSGRTISWEVIYEESWRDLCFFINKNDIILDSQNFTRHFRLGICFSIHAMKQGVMVQYGPLSIKHPKTKEILKHLNISIPNKFQNQDETGYMGQIE
jgi:hypothetical protein